MSEKIQIDTITVTVRRNARARRMTLRVPLMGGDAVLTLPRSVSLVQGQKFVAAKADWLRHALANIPGPQFVTAGAYLPVAGQRILIDARLSGQISLRDGVLTVPADKPVGPVVQAWLKYRAHSALCESVDRYANKLGRTPRAISLRDTRSRWGSCTSDGRLMFSWRLAMAPPDVLDYVAAHEVAHMAHMDHSPRFWKQVKVLMPDYAPWQTWLQKNGAGLQAWQFRD